MSGGRAGGGGLRGFVDRGPAGPEIGAVPDPSHTWLHGLEPLLERRRSNRRVVERRRDPGGARAVERRARGERRVRERRETVGEHLRNALQVLLHATAGRDLSPELRYDVAAAVRRIWLALQELERRPPY